MKKNINTLISDRRKELGLTIEELANAIGVNKGTVSRWESGEIDNMRRDKIAMLAKALSLSPLTIMGIDENLDVSGAVARGKDILKALCKDSSKAQALVEKMRVTEDGDVVITGVDAGSAKVIGHAFRGAVAALDEAELTGDSSMEIVIS